MIVHYSSVLHKILHASKDQTLDQILEDCHLLSMDDNDLSQRDEEDVFQPPRPRGLNEEETLLKEKMTRRIC